MLTGVYGGGGIIFEIIRKEEKCMKKIVLVGLMLSLFTFAGNNEGVNTTYAAEETNLSIDYVCLPGYKIMLQLEDTTYNSKIVSIKISNDSNDLLQFQEKKICEPINIKSCVAFDMDHNRIEDGVASAYISYAFDSTTENPRYDCLIYSNAGTIYASSDSHMMFYGRDSLLSSLEVLDVSMLNTTSVSTMEMMFCELKTIKKIIGIEKFDTSNVYNMMGMFGLCESLTELNVSSFDTSKVTNIASMFEGCKSLTELDVSNFDTSLATDASYMFDKCTSLKRLDLSNFNLSKCHSKLFGFIKNCSSLEFIKMPNALPEKQPSILFPDEPDDEKSMIELPSQLANYYGVTEKISYKNLAQYPAFCIPGDEYAKKWRALRAENGDSICSLLTPGTEGNTKLTQLLAEHDSMNKNYQDYLYLVTDKENVTVGESIAYVKNVLEGKQGTDGNYGLTDENKGSFMTMSIREESPYLIAIISLIGVLSVLGYYFYNKKKQTM